MYASDTGAQSPAQYPSIDITADDDKMRQASTARIGGSTALLDKVAISSVVTALDLDFALITHFNL